MTKKELVDALADWPDDTQVELGIPEDLDSDDPAKEDKVWLEITEVEEPNLRMHNLHCLIFGGEVTMW